VSAGGVLVAPPISYLPPCASQEEPMPSLPTVVVENPKKKGEPMTINQIDYLQNRQKYVLWDVVANKPVEAAKPVAPVVPPTEPVVPTAQGDLVEGLAGEAPAPVVPVPEESVGKKGTEKGKKYSS